MMRFEFATAAKIQFGPGSVRDLGSALRPLGRRALIVTGQNPERSEPVRRLLAQEKLSCVTQPISGEPTIDAVQAASQRARAEGCDLVVGFGGGSAIDAAKAVAGMITNDGALMDYLEVVGRGQSLAKPAAPFVAVPTTAGAGAEVTRNAVILSLQHRVKASLRSPHLLARLALVDPELTLTLPPAITATTGLDALTQLIEPFVSCRANPFTDALCREGMGRVARSLRRAFEHGSDVSARTDMALASLLSGLALANAGLGAVHGFAAPIGGTFPAPHGAVCAALLPPVLEINLRALEQRDPANPARRRFDEIGALLTGKAQASAADAIAWVRTTCAALGIPGLRTYGISSTDAETICDKASHASSMKGNPLPLQAGELREILARAL